MRSILSTATLALVMSWASLLAQRTLRVGFVGDYPQFNYPTLELAVAASRSGDVISMYPGDFSSGPVVTIPHTLTMRGVGYRQIDNYRLSGISKIPFVWQLNVPQQASQGNDINVNVKVKAIN